jgi:hypothetical protein
MGYSIFLRSASLAANGSGMGRFSLRNLVPASYANRKHSTKIEHKPIKSVLVANRGKWVA